MILYALRHVALRLVREPGFTLAVVPAHRAVSMDPARTLAAA